MSRALIVLNTAADRRKVASWAGKLPWGTRVEFKETKRSLPQNDKMWAMLTDVATQATHGGRKYTPDQWKAIFMSACGAEIQFLPSLDGKTFVPYGHRSSDLGKSEMADLIEFITAWCAENGIALHEPSLPAPQTSQEAA